MEGRIDPFSRDPSRYCRESNEVKDIEYDIGLTKNHYITVSMQKACSIHKMIFTIQLISRYNEPWFVRGSSPPLFWGTHPFKQSPPPFFKYLRPLPSALFHPPLRHFRQFPHPQGNPSRPNPTNQPFFV